MHNSLANHAEAYSQETLRCGNCKREFPAQVITWVDVSHTPQAKTALLRWEFNVVHCSFCGKKDFSGTPFFYEDFAEGLLVAVFPEVPEDRGTVEASIREKYGYYPNLEYFYDMTQLWTLLYLQEHYQNNKNLRSLTRIGTGEPRLRKFLKFLKEDPLMLRIREKIAESFFGDAAEDGLVDILNQAVYKLEQMLPWPLDRKCVCGADISRELSCCGQTINLDEHERVFSQQYIIYCASCGESFAGVSCSVCSRVYTWRVGTVDTYDPVKKAADKKNFTVAEGSPANNISPVDQ